MIESLIGFAVFLLLAFLGIPLGFAMIAVGFVGFGLVRGWTASMEMVAQIIVDISMSHGFSVLPLFVLMGAFVFVSGLSDELYDTAHAWLGHYRGGLAMATVAACGGFAAVSGSSLATAATMAKVAMPSMRRYNYSESLASGAIAAGGTLGILIPPSVALVIYGLLANEDIGALFIAGIIPGIVTILLYLMTISVVTRINPRAGPRGPVVSWGIRVRSLSKVWGVVVLFVLIIGGIYIGFFTPTEAGGMGAVGALIFALVRRRINWSQFLAALIEAGRTTAMIFCVAFGALIISNFVNVAGMTGMLVTTVESLDVPPIGVVLAILGIYLVLGCVFDGMVMILVTIPVFAPVVAALGLNMIWFGILVTIAVEVAAITPPIGMNVFVLKTVLPELKLGVIYRGILPFFVADLIRLSLVLLVPSIPLFLPSLMG